MGAAQLQQEEIQSAHGENEQGTSGSATSGPHLGPESLVPESMGVAAVQCRKRPATPANGANGNIQSESTVRGSGTTQTARLECKICMDAIVNTVFVPCGHMAACADCAKALKTAQGRRPPCPICRKKVKFVQNVFQA